MAKTKNFIQIHSILMHKYIKYVRDRGVALPAELVTAKMEHMPRAILQESLDLLLPLVITECYLSEEWEESSIIRGISLKWLTPSEYSIASITLALQREQKQEVLLSMPRLSMDYITEQTKENIETILHHAQQYIEGKYAQLELAVDNKNLPPLQSKSR